MALPVKLVGTTDNTGTTQEVEIGTRRFMQVAIRDGDPPPVGESNRFRYYNALLGSTGADSGTTNMNVDGSGTVQEFYIESHNDYDLRIMKLVVFIGDTAVTHGSFGNVAALGNGWDLKINEAGVGTYIFNSASTGGDVIIQSATDLSWGNTASAFELTNYSGTNDATVVVVDMSMVPGGVRIGRGIRDRITSVVNDDLTGLVDFTVRVIGYKWFA